MRSFLKFLFVLGIMGGLGFGAYIKGIEYLKARNKPEFTTEEVVQGDIRVTVTATGEIKPVLEVLVGSFVSGPILELLVDYNQEVKKDELLARIDPALYQARYDSDVAAWESRKAEVNRVKADLQRARNDEGRAMKLRADNPRYISQAEIDQLKFARQGLDATLKVTEASVLQAEANLKNSKANLEYTEIKSPVDGMVIDRKIQPGQTLAAQFQAPELFVIAPDMRKKMHIEASVNEADMGRIRLAQKAGHHVNFKVPAYRNKSFETGIIEQIRLSALDEQSVVTYPVIVATPNPDMELLPRMTANLTFLVSEKKGVIKVPSKALTFIPAKKEYVCERDQSKLDLSEIVRKTDAEKKSSNSAEPDTTEQRDIWILDADGKLKAVAILTGEVDQEKGYTEVVKGELKPGDQVVTGEAEKSYKSW